MGARDRHRYGTDRGFNAIVRAEEYYKGEGPRLLPVVKLPRLPALETRHSLGAAYSIPAVWEILVMADQRYHKETERLLRTEIKRRWHIYGLRIPVLRTTTSKTVHHSLIPWDGVNVPDVTLKTYEWKEHRHESRVNLLPSC